MGGGFFCLIASYGGRSATRSGTEEREMKSSTKTMADMPDKLCHHRQSVIDTTASMNSPWFPVPPEQSCKHGLSSELPSPSRCRFAYHHNAVRVHTRCSGRGAPHNNSLDRKFTPLSHRWTPALSITSHSHRRG